MSNLGGPTAQANHGGPRTPLQAERQEQKRDLASWWRNFKRSEKKPQDVQAPQGIFGIPLQQSIRYANVAISLFNEDGQSYIYGYVPIIVAKCGVFLKEKATETEGIFRLAGSEKRIKELKVAFDSPDRFGKGLDWTGYTVHDAANILRRYFNQLPEPIIPLDFYERFRSPLRNHQAQSTETRRPSAADYNPDGTIREYQNLITELPPLNRQLLLYILDLLAVFASKSDLNKMTTPNLAAIFQPGILSHPQHDMSPPDYRLSQDVLIFLIENQDSFLIGMQGTAADAATVRDVQSGPTASKAPTSPTTPGRSKTIIGRSSSNASTRAESLRKTGEIRRNVSVSSSKHSKKSENGPTPVVGGVHSPTTSVSGIQRSNTMPSRRDGSSATNSPRFSRERVGDTTTSPVAVDTTRPRQESLQTTPVATTAPAFPPPPVSTSSDVSPPVGSDGGSNTTSREVETPRKDAAPSLSQGPASPEQTATSAQTPPASSGRGLLDIFKQSPGSDSESKKPNKLQKKQRVPSSTLSSSAQSSSHSLPNDAEQQAAHKSSASPLTPSSGTTEPILESAGEQNSAATAQAAATGLTLAQPQPARHLSTEDALRPTVSPTHSYQSATESDADMVGDDLPKDQVASPEREKRRHRWRFSRSQNKFESSPAPSPNPLATMTGKEQATSRSTVDSNSGRKSFQEAMPVTPTATEPSMGSPMQSQTFSSASTDPVFSDSEREKKAGPMSWIRGKIREQKEKDVERRARTPERQRESRQDLQLPPDQMPVRGKSFEAQRNDSEASMPVPASAPVRGNPPTAPSIPAVPASAPLAESTSDDSAPFPYVPMASDHNGVEGEAPVRDPTTG